MVAREGGQEVECLNEVDQSNGLKSRKQQTLDIGWRKKKIGFQQDLK